MKYKTIRGPKQKDRCTDEIKGRLYCPCGCQEPHEDDPKINLNGVVVSGRAEEGYADYTLTRDGKVVGEINTQYCALILDGYEYLGCDRDELAPLLGQIFKNHKSRFPQKHWPHEGDLLQETTIREDFFEEIAIAEEDERNRNHPGWCTKCHSFCYGDCEAY